MESLERLLIENECLRLQFRYAQTADGGDIEGFVALFTPDATITIPEYPSFVGHEAIRESMRQLVATKLTMRHVMTNNLVQVTDAGRAIGGCYLTVYNSGEKPDKFGSRPLVVPSTMGEYVDAFVLTGKGWRFESRALKRVFRAANDSLE